MCTSAVQGNVPQLAPTWLALLWKWGPGKYLSHLSQAWMESVSCTVPQFPFLLNEAESSPPPARIYISAWLAGRQCSSLSLEALPLGETGWRRSGHPQPVDLLLLGCKYKRH